MEAQGCTDSEVGSTGLVHMTLQEFPVVDLTACDVNAKGHLLVGRHAKNLDNILILVFFGEKVTTTPVPIIQEDS